MKDPADISETEQAYWEGRAEQAGLIGGSRSAPCSPLAFRVTMCGITSIVFANKHISAKVACVKSARECGYLKHREWPKPSSTRRAPELDSKWREGLKRNRPYAPEFIEENAEDMRSPTQTENHSNT